MKLYEYEITYEQEVCFKNQKSFLVAEADENVLDTSFCLFLYNNQNREVCLTSDRCFDTIVRGQFICFKVKNVIAFCTYIGSRKILYSYKKEGTKSLRDYWLYHTFLPILLTLEDVYYVLHAGAVEIGGVPVLFVADSFGGKSTLTNFFIQKNHCMISDDKVATYEYEGKIFAVPSYPYQRPYRQMEDLGVYVENFAKKSKPIGIIFHLQKSQPNASIEFTPLQGIEKFKVLRYATDIDLPVNQKSKFTQLSSIANKTKLYNITIPWDLNRLEEVYYAIVQFIQHQHKG